MKGKIVQHEVEAVRDVGASQFKTLKAEELKGEAPKTSKVVSRFFIIDDIDEGDEEEGNDLQIKNNKLTPNMSAVGQDSLSL